VNAKAPQKIPPEFCARTGTGGGGYTSQYNTTGWPAAWCEPAPRRTKPVCPLGIKPSTTVRDDVVLAALAHIDTNGWLADALFVSGFVGAERPLPNPPPQAEEGLEGGQGGGKNAAI